MTHLVSRGLWMPVSKVLERGVCITQHRWAVEQASKHADDDDFAQYIFPQCLDKELEGVMTHLVSRGLWRSVGKVLERGVSSTQHRWAVEQAFKLADDDSFDCFVLCHCSNDDIVNVLLHLAANRKWRCTTHELHDGICDTLHTWMTSQHGNRVHDTLFWKLLQNCRIDASMALETRHCDTGNSAYNSPSFCKEGQF
ncbi:hypothetical protein ACOMHN_030958 [Nucella lapillus]